MITRHPTKLDWFRLDPEDAEPIYSREIPGLKIEGARFAAHRNLITLLDHPDARKFLERSPADSRRWEARDRETAARGFKLRTTQQQAIDFIEPRRGALVGDDMRLGKGHPVGTRILTPDGWRQIEQLRVGDFVVGSDGLPCRLTGLYRRGVLPVFRVKFSDGAGVRVDGDHLWSLWDNDCGRSVVAPTRDLIGNLTYCDDHLRWRAPLVQPIQFAVRQLQTDPYEIGVALALGQVAVDPNLLWSAVHQRIALLQGLMDTGGVRSAGVPEFSCSIVAAEPLLELLRALVRSLGGVAYRYGAWLTINLPSGINPFCKRSSFFEPQAKGSPERLIAKIEPDGEAEVICLSVAAKDQLYVTEDFIVTHNTLTSLMCHDPARGSLVIVAPLQTRAVWLGWTKRVFPGIEMGVLSTRRFDVEKIKKPIVFIHYDIVHAWEMIRKIGTLIIDEAHLIANSKTKRSKGVTLLARWSAKVIALTGTPIWDMPSDLWSLVTTLTEGWGGYYEFCQRYGAPRTTAYGTVYDGLSNGAELRTRMAEVMIRRRWMDVADDVPPITRSVIVADVSDAERNRLDVLAAKLKSERTNTAGNLAAYRQKVAALKAKVVCAQAKTIHARGEPLVIWTWHKSTANAIAEALPGAQLIHGDIPADQREQRMDTWRRTVDGILVATMAVAQVGIDLSHARIAIFAELDYTPAILAQAEMRTFAPTRGMDVIFVVANHIVDQRIVRTLITKLSAADPLGVGAAVDAIDALRDAVIGPNDDGDLDRLLEDLLASEV